jgi:hypothetical protein
VESQGIVHSLAGLKQPNVMPVEKLDIWKPFVDPKVNKPNTTGK